MALAINHHCPVCSKKGNRRCVKLGHIIECDIHKGKFHSRLFVCVSCSEACAREEKAIKRDQGSCSGDDGDDDKQQKKDRKGGKPKPSHQKTIKQLRRELKEEKRKSSAD
ncbi:hypothetical protein KVR01_006938 [Diaporthe batatas]|uniref:uncharacterized protein n=1 Tax=Diaporthe batatas TaxID=748121 RepID=UPI001D0467A6|nr:uncharacterized protein KVR01_006938 [Diaporthe batatas]KAG8163641.1 hypothetical protein KVR01_006938 [Diaporthe batatas]